MRRRGRKYLGSIGNAVRPGKAGQKGIGGGDAFMNWPLDLGVVDELRKQHRPARGQWPPCPPQVQRRGMAMLDGLLPRCLAIDRLQRQRDFNELLPHAVPFELRPNCVFNNAYLRHRKAKTC